MKFIISSESLLKNLQVLGSILNNNNTLPILDCFLFEIENKDLFITSSDLETSLTSNNKIDSSIKSNIAKPAKLLIDIIRSLPDQPLTFSILENNILEINAKNIKFNKIYDSFNDAINYGIKKEYREEDGKKIALFNSSGNLTLCIYKSDPKISGGAGSLFGLAYGDSISVKFISS